MLKEELQQKFDFISEKEREKIFNKIVTFNQKEVAKLTGFTLKRIATAIQKGKLKGLTSSGPGAKRFTVQNISDWYETMQKKYKV